MKIGIIGLGSIGQRHLNCLKELGYMDICALRTNKGSIKSLPDDSSHVKEFFSYKDFFSNKLDGVIISNPTSLHMGSLKRCLEKKVHVLLEKPIADSMAQLKPVENLNVSRVMVAFNLRHNEMINSVRKFIKSGKLGRVYKADLYCGQYLPSWHPYADYSKEYYSIRNMGGGAIRTLSHEIDLMHYFFEKPAELVASVEQLSGMDINVDDNAYLLCRNSKNFLVNVELDYFNPIAARSGTIFASKGKLAYSITSSSNSTAQFVDNGGNSRLLYENLNTDRNQMYLSQMKSFIRFVKTGRNECTFQDGRNVMKVIDAAERSSRRKKWQSVL